MTMPPEYRPAPVEPTIAQATVHDPFEEEQEPKPEGDSYDEYDQECVDMHSLIERANSIHVPTTVEKEATGLHLVEKQPSPQPEKKQSGSSFASLDAGLLARKGAAVPALSQDTKILADAGVVTRLVPNVTDNADIFENPHHDRAGGSKRSAPTLPSSTERPSVPKFEINEDLPMARVSFRMPMTDFLRLKMAGAILEAPCRDIVMAALNQYLDQHQIGDLRSYQSQDDCKAKAG